MMKCRKQRTYHLLSTRQNLRSNASFKMTYVRDTPLALSFCTGSDHPELPRMIRANSDFQHWASPDDLDPDRSDRSGGLVWPVWPKAVYLHNPKWEMMLWIIIWRTLSFKAQVWVHKSDSKYCKHNFNTCKLFVCFDQICKWVSSYSLLNKVRYSKS